jgi:hypothetical protein
MMMVVPYPILESRRRPCRLDAPDELASDEHAKGVVHRLERDGADLLSDELGHFVGRYVRPARDRPHHRQPLSGNLDAALA